MSSPETGLRVTRDDDGEVTVLRLAGYLDAHTASLLDREIGRVVEEGRTRIVADLKELDYISSAGLGVFMSHLEPLRDRGGDLKIARLVPRVRNVFDIVGFGEIFALYDDDAAAIEAFGASDGVNQG